MKARILWLLPTAVLLVVIMTCRKDFSLPDRPIREVRGFGDRNGPVLVYYDPYKSRLELYFHRNFVNNGQATDYYYSYMVDSVAWSGRIRLQDVNDSWLCAYLDDSAIPDDGVVIFKYGANNVDANMSGSILYNPARGALEISIYGLSSGP